MSEKTFICAREECQESFSKKTHNQKYHNDECCRLATNSRIMERYYERRAQRNGSSRLCRSCKKTKLSRYNSSEVCSPCKRGKNDAANATLAYILRNSKIVA